MKKFYLILLISFLIFTCPSIFAADINNQTKQQSFTIKATINKGCLLTDSASFGSLNFGDNISGLNSSLNTLSNASSGGSIVVKCTPNTSISIALNTGAHAGTNIAAGRFLLNSNTNETLRYQLYKDASYSQIWGNNSNGGSTLAITTNGLSQEFKIYGTLFSTTTLPSAGQYADHILVTVTY
ncbi:Csu type fimbrial protein [Neisseria sp. Ec49-e6-T10]|uniref:Csu type fimbrial protein n=1 Tax=Neisseria sp. Ec49-e6-T10 TaxID=3140744 RepID=UPI003EC02BA0